jgi:hypothetical protein
MLVPKCLHRDACIEMHVSLRREVKRAAGWRHEELEAKMGSLKFKPFELEIIDRVYEAAWAQILARHPGRELENDTGRQEALRKRLLILADRRPIEFDTLRERALMSMPETLMSDTNGRFRKRIRRSPARRRRQAGARAAAE